MATITLTRAAQAIAGTPGSQLVVQNLAPARAWVSEQNSNLPGASLQSAGLGSGATLLVTVPSSGTLYVFAEEAGGSLEYKTPTTVSTSTAGGDALRPSPYATLFTSEFDDASVPAALTAAAPGRVSVAAGNLTLVQTAQGFSDNHVYTAVSSFDTRTVLRVGPGVNNPNGVGPIARRQGTGATGACYAVNANFNGAMTIYRVSAAGAAQPLAAEGVVNFTPNDGYEVILETISVSPTFIQASVQALDGTVVASTFAVDNTADHQAAPGSAGLTNWSSGPASFDSLRIDGRPAPGVRGGIRIGFPGDSITFGNGTGGGAATLPNQTATKLAAKTGISVVPTIRGVSGTTVADWLNSTGGASLAGTKAAFQAAGVNVVSIMLGTNDSKNSVATSTETYLARLTQLANEMLSIPGVQAVVLHGLPLQTRNGTDFNHRSLRRITRYNDALPSICTGSQGRGILLGDHQWFGYLAANSAQVADGVHPDSTACVAGGDLHSNAIIRALGLLG